MHFGGDLQSIFTQLRHGAMHPSVVRHRDIERQRTQQRSELRWRKHSLASLQSCAAWRLANNLAIDDDASLAQVISAAQTELDQLDVESALAMRDNIEAEQSEIDDSDDDIDLSASDDEIASHTYQATAIGELNFWHDMDRKLTGFRMIID